jgi:hypothetical protein
MIARAFRTCWAILIAAFALPGAACAQFVINAEAVTRFESNSNVFDLQSGFPAQGAGGNFQRSDTFYSYGAQFDAKYLWGIQEFYASAVANQFEYQHFSQLTHNDYKIDAGLNWKLSDIVDGKLDVARTHLMVPFVDLTEQVLALSLQTEQRETAEIAIKVTPDWKVSAEGFTRTLEEPQPEAPNLELKETSGTAAVRYLGVAGFTGGLSAGYLTGNFDATNGTDNPSYHQVNAGFVGNYKSGHSSIDAQVGYTNRTSATGVDSISGATGEFKLQDQLTPKTGVSLTLSRLISSYVSTASSEIDTNAGVAANWQALYKLDVVVGYTFTYRDFPRQGNNPLGSDRIDHQQYASLEIEYRPQPWLSIRPYANVQRRGSNFIGGDFDATIFGVSVVFKMPEKRL